MTPERWEQIRSVVEQALEIEPGERAALLDHACSSDESLRLEVEALLRADDPDAASFLESPPVSEGLMANLDAMATGAGIQTGLQAGQVFAERFQLVRKLGEGGMGQVWLAEQTSPVRRQVALKLIKAGMYDEAVLQRFEAERQSLAIMDHPSIAKVFDAGTTPQGQPFFVMEFVPGVPITEYCDQKRLKIRDRLELFIQVCEGVQHAHQKAILHRDLKPANILVVEIDGKPVPRIIDFGLSKAASPQVDGRSLFTQVGHFVGTPGYMSPEQADPEIRDIDTRTDVYSLGAVLYVLLSGARPFESKGKEKLPLHKLLRRMREEEPPSPSERVSSEGDRSSPTAEARSTEPRQLVKLLRGDLDWITMKALEKERARRYGTPSELAADIRRYLKHDAVLARPASTGYRLRKYLRRNRIAAGIAAGLVLLLGAFLAVQTIELRRITRERDRANSERDRATRITDFMTEMFKVADPTEARGNTVTAREILDKASTQIEGGLAKDPEVQSQMMQVMGRTYENLGLYPRALDLATRARDTRLRLLGPDNPQTLESTSLLGWLLEREGHFAEAENLEREAATGARRVLGADDALTLTATDHLAAILEDEGHYEEEEKLEREVIAATEQKAGGKSTQLISPMINLGSALWHEGRYSEAEQEDRELLEFERPALGPDHRLTLAAEYNLGLAVEAQGSYPQAEQIYREILATDERVLGADHPETLTTMESLASVLMKQNRFGEPEKLYRDSLAIRLRTLGPEHPDTLLTQYNLGELLLNQGHVREAEQLQRRTLATQIRVLGAAEPDTLASQSGLAKTLIKEGQYAEAEDLARKSFQIQLRSLGPQHSDTIDSLRQLGRALAYEHRYEEASALFRDAIDRQEQSKIKTNPSITWYSFAVVAAGAKRPNDAMQYLQEAVSRGYKDADAMAADDDLKNLRHNARFQQLIANLKNRSARTQAR